MLQTLSGFRVSYYFPAGQYTKKYIVRAEKVETGFRMFLLLTYSNQNKRIQIEIFLFNELYELTMATGTNRRWKGP